MAFPNWIKLLLFSTLILISLNSTGQAAKFKGQVIDKNSKETLSGALITILGTDLKTMSDMDGEFSFENLKSGTYKIQISYISYNTIIVNNLEIQAGFENTIKAAMEPVETKISKELESFSSKQLIAQELNQATI